MYSCLKNIQILVALLKKYNVKNIVISPGTRHTPFVYSVEHDDFFKTYSIVDERSAGFFAIGLIEVKIFCHYVYTSSFTRLFTFLRFAAKLRFQTRCERSRRSAP